MQPLPKSFTLTLHHSRPKYTNLDLPQIANEDNDADHAQTSKEISSWQRWVICHTLNNGWRAASFFLELAFLVQKPPLTS
jgi:hypothetical protein